MLKTDALGKGEARRKITSDRNKGLFQVISQPHLKKKNKNHKPLRLAG